MRGLFLCCVMGGALAAAAERAPQTTEPLWDWSAWEKYRSTVVHPGVTFKAADLARAKANQQQYAWARGYVAGVEKNARRYLARMTPEFLLAMIPQTTPGDSLWTPCPSCRALGKPVHPHGLWTWRLDDPEHIECTVCRVQFPNAKFPEDVVLQTQWRTPQTISYCGGETFVIFGYKTGRPSFSANVRARKVKWIADYCRTLAEAHLLTGKPEYARACRDVLLRLAACYPGWLVHVGYGEYADLDPHVAAQSIQRLPEPELCPPPNKPDRRLHTGYWSAGRASGVGMESWFVRQVVEAYDFTCAARDAGGAAIYSDAQRRQIERDLLLESTILLVCDKQINNKSVSNRTAAALVGMCVGHPELVRFGLEGFYQTVDGWFLSDGATSESPAYGQMTLGGIVDLAQAFRGYSDPPGYRDAQSRRIDSLDLYHGTAYERVWDCCYRGLQGDLTYPPSADSMRDTRLGTNYLELLVANYPDRPHYLAVLQETLRGPRARSGRDDNRRDLLQELPGSGLALYVREPGLEKKPLPPLTLPDWNPPALRIAHLRTGVDGRESLATLSASHWGNHHHYDSLDLYYWREGRELLSDLGYLWDHPLKSMATRSVAHNTVLLDEKDQVTKDRGGEVLFFRSSPHVKVAEATSRAYPQAQLYRRTAAMVDHGDGRSYLVDVFRVEGGARQDYVYHGAAATCETFDVAWQPAAEKLYDFTNVRAAQAPGVWRSAWPCGDRLRCTAWNLGQPSERVLLADGWGQRDWKNSDIGATIPYVVRRCVGPGVKTFISVFEGHAAGAPFVRGVKRIEPAGAICVETAIGRDYLLSALDTGTLQAPSATPLKAHFAVVAQQNGQTVWTFTEPAPTP